MNWHDWQSALLEAIADPAQQEPPAGLQLRAAGLAVYRNNYRVGLIDALSHSHPVCLQLVGEEFFTALARKYVKGHASHSGNLHLYGDAFADFIAGFAHCRDLPYLADVARLEWAVHRSYYAADIQPLDSGALAAIAPEQWDQLCFTPLPDVALCPAATPAASIWLAHRDGGSLEGILQRPAENTLVLRRHGEIQMLALDPARHAFYAALFKRQPLGNAIGPALQLDEGFDLQAALLGLFQPPLLSAIHLQGSST
ncbi:putative DNA-binding domain-containing protein [Chromobacterium sphagni]|uniref:Putative DNA-binding domain-containing protein n=1 Tax=Chromobacterium sphagni TaxID=1903179 RepID=A0ABX3CGI4_9NEIS|nr:putative DNA-binding domain-containing protein [Chromobacterium sphagni]OHX21077.1 hypothetical protein BI344_00550 [Chromobacterium sphagni]